MEHATRADLGRTWSSLMNAILPFVAVEQTPARRDSIRRPDPATLAIIGCAAAAMLAAAALMAVLGEAESAGPALGGNVALILFAVMNANRPYRRSWGPGLIFLALAGASGVALALLPAAEQFVTPPAIARFALEGLHGVGQLGAMGMMAFAWATVGRSARGARWSMATFAMVTLQLGEAAAQALTGSTGDAWTFASELLFTSWLLATALGLTRRLGGHVATDQIGKPEQLPAEPVDMLREIDRHGDRVR
jgi:hypothetical protein